MDITFIKTDKKHHIIEVDFGLSIIGLKYQNQKPDIIEITIYEINSKAEDVTFNFTKYIKMLYSVLSNRARIIIR